MIFSFFFQKHNHLVWKNETGHGWQQHTALYEVNIRISMLHHRFIRLPELSSRQIRHISWHVCHHRSVSATSAISSSALGFPRHHNTETPICLPRSSLIRIPPILQTHERTIWSNNNNNNTPAGSELRSEPLFVAFGDALAHQRSVSILVWRRGGGDVHRARHQSTAGWTVDHRAGATRPTLAALEREKGRRETTVA